MKQNRKRQLLRLLKEYKKSIVQENVIVTPTPKQLKRGDLLNGQKYTIVTRPQSNGKILVAAVYQNGKLVEKGSLKYVDNKMQIKKAIKQILRWIDKLGGDSKMASRSRDR